ncbi:MAG: hypothetical protein ACRED5_08310 [Propylenella sp.]
MLPPIPSRKTWLNALALLAVGVSLYVVLKLVEVAYGLSDLPVCAEEESILDCARSWSGAVALVFLALALLVFMRRQTDIAARQTGIADRLEEISGKQQKASLLKELIERRAEIDNVTDGIAREFMKLQFTAEIAVARNVVVTLQSLIEAPAFVNFTSVELRFEFRRLLEQVKERHAAGSLDLKRLPIESLLDRLFERSLEAQDGWETTYEALMGEPIARPARELLEKWRADKAAVRPRLKK